MQKPLFNVPADTASPHGGESSEICSAAIPRSSLPRTLCTTQKPPRLWLREAITFPQIPERRGLESHMLLLPAGTLLADGGCNYTSHSAGETWSIPLINGRESLKTQDVSFCSGVYKHNTAETEPPPLRRAECVLRFPVLPRQPDTAGLLLSVRVSFRVCGCVAEAIRGSTWASPPPPPPQVGF